MKHTILFLFIGLCIASCHETDYPTFDDSVIDIYFTQDSVNYSLRCDSVEYDRACG